MSRTSILYDTLDELEREFVSILLKELQSIASGHSSRFFSRKIAYLFEGKFWQDANTLRVEEIEKDIIALREKLAEPLDGGPTGLAEEFAHRRAELPDRHKGGEVHLAAGPVLEATPCVCPAWAQLDGALLFV